MKVHRLLLILFFFILPLQGAQAWNLEDHRLLSRLALESVASDWWLDQPCEKHTLQSFLNKLGQIRPELSDAWHFADYLRINPKINLEAEDPSLKDKRNLTPIEILSAYAVDPDDGRDQDLFVRDARGIPHYAYPDQKWFGAMMGGNSQAFRHIEKPPFAWKHPLSTFGFPFGKVGEATSRVEIYFQVSLLAFSLHEDYWGWRFLANALHYLEDLHQPYHTGQITPDLLFRGLKAYVSWGYKKLGFMGTFSHLVSNSHRFYESYIDNPGIPDSNAYRFKEEALQSVQAVETPPLAGSPKDLAIRVRDSSNLLFPTLVADITQIATPKLLGEHSYLSDGDQADNPQDYFQKGPAFDPIHQEIFRITQERFKSAGKAIRTIVQVIVQTKDLKKPEEVLNILDQILQPTSS